MGDFGLAWLSIKDQEGYGTESGGSPLYESPESLQVRLKTATADVYTEQSDVWSYSMVVWEIFKQKVKETINRLTHFSLSTPMMRVTCPSLAPNSITIFWREEAYLPLMAFLSLWLTFSRNVRQL